MFCFFIILLIFLLPPNKRYDHMQEDRLTFADDIRHAFRQATGRNRYDHTFIITDHNCRRLCLPLLDAHDIPFISIAPGEENKNLESLAKIWKYLSDNKCTRHSLIVNIGGGVITDMGSFAAATFKRGTAHINIPTTLLAMTDASTGGKTGIDFNGLKNEIGCFSAPEETIIYAPFLNTLNTEAMLSGYAEMLKHGLIAGMRQLTDIMQFDITHPDCTALQTLIKESLEIKTGIVRQDPMENGCRKALNFGHTIGHALESLAMETGHAVPHGYAVAWGMVCELYLSAVRLSFPTAMLHQMTKYIAGLYGRFYFDCKQYDRIYDTITHDKKNTGDSISCTLLKDVGRYVINEEISKNEIFEALDYYRECM